MIQLICTHCKQCFEAEKKEGSVCPSCGWSSSVLTVTEFKKKDLPVSPKKFSPKTSNWLPGFLIFVLKIVGAVALLALFVWGGTRFLKSAKPRAHSIQVSKESQDLKINVTTAQSSQSGGLTLNEQSLLNATLKISIAPELADLEQKNLQQAVDLTAGQVEKLPSTSWTFPQYQDFIQTQEKTFHMPLARSYKKSLEELFQKNYAPAYDLFLAGRFQQARDAYVAALGFPLYSSDLRKHRAVILTMMRAFVNDTIAKVAAINFTLARQTVSGQTEQMTGMYAELQQKIRSELWSEALAILEKLETQMPNGNVVAPVLKAPPYTTGFEKVDVDVQASLLHLLRVPTFAFDANALTGDLALKKELLQKLADPDRKSSVENYAQATQKIAARSWAEAKSFLREVKSPAELKHDAEQKIEILDKLLTGTPQATVSGEKK